MPLLLDNDDDADNDGRDGDAKILQLNVRGIGLIVENLMEQKINRERYLLSYNRIPVYLLFYSNTCLSMIELFGTV